MAATRRSAAAVVLGQLRRHPRGDPSRRLLSGHVEPDELRGAIHVHRRTAEARRVGFDGLSPFFDGLMRQAFPNAEFVARRRDDAGCAGSSCPRRSCACAPRPPSPSRLYAAAVEVAPGRDRKAPAGHLPRPHVRSSAPRSSPNRAPLPRSTRAAGCARSPATAPSTRGPWSHWPAACSGPATRGRWPAPGGAGRPSRRRLCASSPRNGSRRSRPCSPLAGTGCPVPSCWRCWTPPVPIARTARWLAIGLGHEGPVAAAWLDGGALERQVLQTDMVVGIRILLRRNGFGYLAEDMALIGRQGAQSPSPRSDTDRWPAEGERWAL